MIRQGLEQLARLARPLLLNEARCPGCGLVGQQAGQQAAQAGPGPLSSLCPDCRSALVPQEGAACPGCGQPFELPDGPSQGLSPELADGACAACRAVPRPWGRLVAFGPYEGPLRELILGYKFQARLGLGRQLQECLLAAYERGAAAFPELLSCDLLVPVPLHPWRLSWRGFNQSRELSRLLARRRKLPICQEALLRVRQTVPQMELDRAMRAENIRGAFAARPELVAGRTALMVDDIMTTGSTLEECARTLAAGGARAVHVLVLARA